MPMTDKKRMSIYFSESNEEDMKVWRKFLKFKSQVEEEVNDLVSTNILFKSVLDIFFEKLEKDGGLLKEVVERVRQRKKVEKEE